MAIKVHREFEITGNRDQVAQFAERVNNVLPEPWSPDLAPRAEMGFKYFVFNREKEGHTPAAMLFLASEENGAKVVNIVPREVDSLTIDEYNMILSDFSVYANRVAAELDLSITEIDENADLSRWLSKPTLEKLRSFSQSANKSTGSAHPLDFERWVKFIAAAFAENSKLSATILGRYLTEEEGWPDDHASDLLSEFEFGSSLLDVLTVQGTIKFK